mgnify:CR=1 FL=1
MKKRLIIGIIILIILCLTGVCVYVFTRPTNEENVPSETEPPTTQEEAQRLIKEELGDIELEFQEEKHEWYLFNVTAEGQNIKRVRFNKFTNEIVPIHSTGSSSGLE